MNKTIYSKEHAYLVRQLKQARKEANLTQVEVANTLAKTQSYISKVENGDLRLDVIQLKRFANLYKKELQFFLN